MHTSPPNGIRRATLIRLLLTVSASAALIVGGGCALISQPGVTPVAPADQVPAVSPERLRAHVEHLAVDLWPRSYEHANAQRAANYVVAQFAALGLQPKEQVFELAPGHTQRNITVRLGPPLRAAAEARSPQEAGLIVVGAHVDSHGNPAVNPPTRDSHTPGADDNASGVAGLVELARMLAAKPPSHAVELVAYATEEPPHFAGPRMGSAVHAQALRDAGTPVRLMLSLEMIGYFSDAPGSQRYPVKGLSAMYGDRGDFLALIAPFTAGDMQLVRRVKALAQGATQLPVRSLNAPAFVPGVDFSDHRNYWALGMPALMVTDTSFMRNPHYHLASDTPDTLDYVRMAEAIKAVYAVVTGY